MMIITVSKARENFADIINKSAYRNERISLTKNGNRIAAIISDDDLKMLEAFEDIIDEKEAKRILSQDKRFLYKSVREELDL